MGRLHFHALLQNAQLWSLVALVFFLPSNLFLTVSEYGALVQGLRVDYLIPKLYLTDIFILGILIVWCTEWYTTKRKKAAVEVDAPRQIAVVATVCLIVLFVAVQLVVSTRPVSTLWFMVNLVEFGVFFGWLVRHSALLRHSFVKLAFLSMLIFQSVLGLLQFSWQRSVFPSYTWLGETRLQHYAGISKGAFGGAERILPYGTTAHPNILAGVLAIGAVACAALLLRGNEKQHRWLIVLSFILSITVLLLTQSFSGMLAVVLGIWIVWMRQRKKWLSPRGFSRLVAAMVVGTPLLLQLISEQTTLASITRRTWLNQAALELFVGLPLTGVGLNTFTAHVEKVMPITEVVRFVQPVHHVPLLILSEVGIAGMVLIGICLWVWWRVGEFAALRKNWRELSIIAVPFLPLLTLDHYLWTNQVGMLLWIIGGYMLYKTLRA